MIQDIAPHKLDINYHREQPQEDSAVLLFSEDELLIRWEDGISFPSYGEIRDYCASPVYLFALDKRAFFGEIVGKEKLNLDLLSKEKGRCRWIKKSFLRKEGPKEYAFAAVTGFHLAGWYQRNRFCGKCGATLEHDGRERMLCCPVCRDQVYPRINPAVIVAVTDGERLLLTRYRGREYKGYALVAGFNEIGESLEETVAREVKEETGLSVKNIRYYKSQPWGFADNILIGYFCELDGDGTITLDAEELAEAEWVKREEITVKPEDMSLTNEMICRFAAGEKIKS